MQKKNIVVVDDEKDMREFLEIMLRKEGYDCRSFPSGSAALEWLRENRFDLVITDVRMPGMGGVDFLKAAKELDPDVPVMMITAYASVDTAIEAMKAGAYDYFIKPFNVEEIKLNIRNALGYRDLKRENKLLKKDLLSKYDFSSFIGKSKSMAEVYALITSVASTRTNVFITGESGTGKELVARAIHYESDRSAMPFVAVNCGAMPENLLESELFGYQKGAFTGAVSTREGLAREADGGTLFLDEITELPLHLQVKLLRFIQEKSYRMVGGTADVPADIRLIAASNKDVEGEVKAGRFREDLFYRLNVIRVNVPPLRERKEDVPVLAEHFTKKYSRELGKGIKGISAEAAALLAGYNYSGNVRELENIIERAVALEPSDTISMESLPPYLKEKAAYSGAVPTKVPAPRPRAGEEAPKVPAPGITDKGIDLEKALEEFEKTMILDALKRSGGIKKKAAELLGLSFRSMRYKLGKYDIREN